VSVHLEISTARTSLDLKGARGRLLQAQGSAWGGRVSLHIAERVNTVGHTGCVAQLSSVTSKTLTPRTTGMHERVHPSYSLRYIHTISHAQPC